MFPTGLITTENENHVSPLKIMALPDECKQTAHSRNTCRGFPQVNRNELSTTLKNNYTQPYLFDVYAKEESRPRLEWDNCETEAAVAKYNWGSQLYTPTVYYN